VRLVLPLVGKSKDRRGAADRRSSPHAVRLDGGGGLGLRSRSHEHEGIGDQIVYGLARLAAVIITIHSVNHIFIRLLANFLLRSGGNNAGHHDIIRGFRTMLQARLWVSALSITCKASALSWRPSGPCWPPVALALPWRCKSPPQKSLNTSILLDKPFQGEDLLDVGGILAWVEHVGIRSTRLCSLKGELVIMTNSSLMSQPVHNHGNSRKMPPPIEHGAMEHQLVLDGIDNIENATFSRCHFVQFGASRLDF